MNSAPWSRSSAKKGRDPVCGPGGVVDKGKAPAVVGAAVARVLREAAPRGDGRRATWTRARRARSARAATATLRPASGLKALKAATDATAGALVEIKRENEALEDRRLCDLHGGRRAADGRLRPVQPLPRLRLVRRRAPGVPQLPRDDHDTHDDRELELGWGV